MPILRELKIGDWVREKNPRVGDPIWTVSSDFQFLTSGEPWITIWRISREGTRIRRDILVKDLKFEDGRYEIIL